MQTTIQFYLQNTLYFLAYTALSPITKCLVWLMYMISKGVNGRRKETRFVNKGNVAPEHYVRIAKEIIKELNITPSKVVFKKYKKGHFGVYDIMTKKVTVNLWGDEAIDLNTLAHELRHCWQHENFSEGLKTNIVTKVEKFNGAVITNTSWVELDAHVYATWVFRRETTGEAFYNVCRDRHIMYKNKKELEEILEERYQEAMRFVYSPDQMKGSIYKNDSHI